MEFIKNLLWVFAGSFLGKMVVSIFLIQILIIKNCTRKMMEPIRNDHEYWDSAACAKYLNGVVWKNRIIILVITLLVLRFAPFVASVAYGVSALLLWFISVPKSGLNDDNMKETCEIFLRFAKPEMKQEMEELLPNLVMEMKLKNSFK